MDHAAHCAEIITQTELLVTGLAGADLRVPVPSCPDWTLGGLLRHIGGGSRWAADMVASAATGPLPDRDFRDVAGDDSGPVPADWLRAGAHQLADVLRAAGPDGKVWTPTGAPVASFYARRFTHETLVHRADALLAAGRPVSAAADVVTDAIDEWTELDALPAHFDITPAKRELLGPGRTLVFRATDGPAWRVDLTGPVIRWERSAAPAAATVAAPLTTLLLMLYRRCSLADVAVSGDGELLDLWWRHAVFG